MVEEIKASIKCVKLTWQHGVTHDGDTPAFVANCELSIVVCVAVKIAASSYMQALMIIAKRGHVFLFLYCRADVMPSTIYWFNKEWSWKSGVGCW